MKSPNDNLKRVYEKTNGKCHLCGRGLCFRNHGRAGARGAWEIEHSRPRAKGGTDHGNNLFPAHIPCNRSKGTRPANSVRAAHGLRRPPLSAAQASQRRSENTVAGALIGGLVGLVFGPAGAAIGATVGGALGNDRNPEADNSRPKTRKAVKAKSKATLKGGRK